MRLAVLTRCLAVGAVLALVAPATADASPGEGASNPGVWPDLSTPTTQCASGVIEGFDGTTLRGWTNACTSTPTGAAFGVNVYVGMFGASYGGVTRLTWYGAPGVNTLFAFPLPTLIPEQVGWRNVACLSRFPTNVMVGPLLNRCVAVTLTATGPVATIVSWKDPQVLAAQWFVTAPEPPNCGTCL